MEIPQTFPRYAEFLVAMSRIKQQMYGTLEAIDVTIGTPGQ